MAPYDLYRHTVVWLTAASLLAAIAGRRHLLPMFAAFIGSVLLARILVTGTILSEAEVAGAGLALLLAAVLGLHRRTRILAVLLGSYVVALRLEPFRFQLPARPFELMPFASFMYGSVEVNVMSFLEKFFLYGSLVWLLTEAGLRVRSATAAVAAGLLLTSFAEIYLPGRSAEVTDAVMALLAGAILGSLRPRATERESGTGVAQGYRI
jgi:hypothetical protein